LKPYSLMRRITIGLTATMLVASLCAFGWLYLKTEWTDATLHEQTLLDQARVIAKYLAIGDKNSIQLNLPPRLAEAYSNPESPYRYAVRDANGQYLFDGGMTVAPLPTFANSHLKLYDYDPDGAGPLHVFGAALRTEVGHRTLFIQVEQQAHDPDYLSKAVVDEFITDGGWLEILFLFVLLGVSILIVNRAIAPMKQISALAESIGPTNANIRLPVDQVPLEILPLVRSMNEVLDRLDQGLQRQREFNANAAHQLRTPLSVLMANVETLKEPELASRLRTDVEHMSRIVSQLLLVARLETFSVNLEEIIDLNDAAADIAGSLAPLALASAKSIELIRNDEPVLVRASLFALRAALGNLIENALKHTPAGTSVRLCVTDRPSIEVMDRGPGIPVDQRTKIFERFWRGDRSAGGAGLGLAIVDRIMKALQGSVSVGEAPGGGAMFTLVFPSTAAASPGRVQRQSLVAE
jgi:signal transduction histidine kinase